MDVLCATTSAATEESSELAALLTRACRGDQQAFAGIYRRFAQPVYGLCLHLLGSKEAAEDAAGEVFLRLPRALRTYQASLPFERWLLRVAANHCTDLLRARRREGRLISDQDLETLPAESQRASPLDGLMDEERRAALRQAVGRLPDKYRVPLALRYYSGLDYESIGRQLGLKPNHVGILLFRAKQELRRALAEWQGETQL